MIKYHSSYDAIICDVFLSEKNGDRIGWSIHPAEQTAEIVSTCRHRAKFRFDKASNAPA